MTRELHLGNIANVAYGYCRLLRSADHQASLLCYDLDHPLSQPEWYDGDFPTTDDEEEAFDPSDPRYEPFTPPDWYRRIKSLDFYPKPGQEAGPWTLDDESIDTLVRFSRRYGKRWTVTRGDVMSYKPLVEVLANHFFDDCDVTFGYAYAAIPPLLYSLKPYVPVEIGTLRELPFEDSSLGRLLALAYRTAPHVIITNPDVRLAAEELGVENYTFVPHPVDCERWKPASAEEKPSLHKAFGADHLLFAPARQNWRLKGNDKYFRAFAQLVKMHYKVKLIVTAWGQEVERSQKLVKELGVEDNVIWLNPVPEKTLTRFYQGVDLVLDQFGDCGTFGLITPKAMSCGVPVLISYKPEVHNWCYSEHPPLVSVNSEKEIFDWTLHYLVRSEERNELSRKVREWMVKHHSEKVIVERINKILEEVRSDEALRRSPFSSLKQKRLELSYEAACAESYNKLYHGGVATRMMDDVLVSTISRHISRAGFEAPAVLDLGCGPGSLTDKLLSIPNVKLTGVDISPAMIREARRKFPQVEFFVDDAEALSFEDNSLDAVFCSGVLHHFPALDMALKEIHRVLKPGGLFVAREPNDRNFSALFPELAFAHLCLRHYLLNAFGTGQPAEPEAHEFHGSFDFAKLPDQIGERFLVTDFQTDLQVSYFYDMITDPGMKPPLELLDRTLEGIPGLNAVVVAEKSDRTGVSEVAAQKIIRQSSKGFVDARHFHQLSRFANRVFQEHKAEYFQDTLAAQPHECSYQHLLRHPSAHVLITGDDLEECRRRVYGYSRKPSENDSKAKGWFSRQLRKPSPKTFLEVKSVDQLSPEDVHRYDMALLLVNQNISAENIAASLDCVRDYGLMCLELREGVNLADTWPEGRTDLNQLTVLRNTVVAYPKPTRYVFLSRHLYSPRDFYRALGVAVEKARTGVVGEDAAKFHALLAQVGTELLARENEFSSLALTEKYAQEGSPWIFSPCEHGTHQPSLRSQGGNGQDKGRPLSLPMERPWVA